MKQLTLGESMALAVLRGDLIAAYALADQLTEERLREGTTLDRGYSDILHGPALGHSVYHWPEFKAFAKRLGFLWDLHSMDCTIFIPLEGMVKITQDYAGRDKAPQAIDTTTVRNEEHRTYSAISQSEQQNEP